MLFPLLSVVAPAAPDLAARVATRVLFTPRGRRSSARGDRFLATGIREDHDIGSQRIATWRWQPHRDGTRSRHQHIATSRPGLPRLTTSPHHIATTPDSRVVFCLHGWGGAAAQFAAIAPRLVARGMTVVAIDGPGHGKSAGHDSSLPAMRDVLIALASREVGPVSVVAHSGGAVATVLAMLAGIEVSRLAFVGPPLDPSELMEQQALAAGLSRPVLEGVKRRAEARFGLPWTAFRMLPIAVARHEPLLVVHDREDAEVPWSDGAAIADAWPGARLMSTEGLGHRRVLYDPAVADAVAAFIHEGPR